MEEMRIIRDNGTLTGTCYMEILPGKYEGKCWCNESIYFEEETFRPIEYIIEGVVPGYDHYAFTIIEKKNWIRIIEKLQQFLSHLQRAKELWEVEDALHFMYRETRQEFALDFQNNKNKLFKVINEFCDWLESHLDSRQYISVLGL